MRLLFSPFICSYDLLIALGTCWCMRDLASAQLKVLRGFAVGEKSERERERDEGDWKGGEFTSGCLKVCVCLCVCAYFKESFVW